MRLSCSTFCCVASTVCMGKGGEEGSRRLFIHVFTAHARAVSHGAKMPSQKKIAPAAEQKRRRLSEGDRRDMRNSHARTSLAPSPSSATVFLFFPFRSVFFCFFFHLLRPHMRHTDTFPSYLWTEQWQHDFLKNKNKKKTHKRAAVSRKKCNHLSLQAAFHLSFHRHLVLFPFPQRVAHCQVTAFLLGSYPFLTWDENSGGQTSWLVGHTVCRKPVS